MFLLHIGIYYNGWYTLHIWLRVKVKNSNELSISMYNIVQYCIIGQSLESLPQ